MSDNLAQLNFNIDALLSKIAENCEDNLVLDSFVKSGKNALEHNVITEAIILDENWITNIEQYLFSLEQIVKDPKKSIIDEQILVNVEKAKKINSRSIQYLASHTQHISSITNGEVRPNKVMTTEMNEDYKTYENKFIFTLIDKVDSFVRARYNEIKSKINIHRIDNIKLESSFNISDVEIDCNLSLSVKDIPKGTMELEKNYALLHRIEILIRRLKIIKASHFWQMLEGTRPITPPIIKTNLITKNVDYSNAYKLWIFISAYTFEGFTLEVERKMLPYDQEYFNDLAYVTALLVNATRANNKIRREIFSAIPPTTVKEKKYKVITKYNYQPSFSRTNSEVGDNIVNQYYFDEMKKLIGKTTETLKRDSLVETKNINLTFAKFYRSMTKVANAIYADVLKVEEKSKTKKKQTRVDIAKKHYNYQAEVYRRAKILSRLKSEELSKTLKLESKELVKLEKLKFDLDQLLEKKVNKKKRSATKKQKIQSIKEKGSEILEIALKEREELIETESERQERMLEERRLKLEQQKENRERRLLARLKAKYDEQ